MSGPTLVNQPDAKELRAELWISAVLRVGVSLSLGLILLGLLICFLHHPQYVSSKQELDRLIAPGAAFPRTLSDVSTGLRDFRGQAIIALGLLTLILTPLLRVAISIAAFLEERDWLYAAITTGVLTILLFSFWLGRIS